MVSAQSDMLTRGPHVGGTGSVSDVSDPLPPPFQPFIRDDNRQIYFNTHLPSPVSHTQGWRIELVSVLQKDCYLWLQFSIKKM